MTSEMLMVAIVINYSVLGLVVFAIKKLKSIESSLMLRQRNKAISPIIEQCLDN